MKKNGTIKWIVGLVIAVIVAVVGWTLYGGERTSKLEHQTILTQVESNKLESEKADAALESNVKDITNCVNDMGKEISSLKTSVENLTKSIDKINK